MWMRSLSMGLLVAAATASQSCPAGGAIIVTKADKAIGSHLDLDAASNDLIWLVTSTYGKYDDPTTHTTVGVGKFKSLTDGRYYKLLDCDNGKFTADVYNGMPGVIRCRINKGCVQKGYKYSVCIGSMEVDDPEIRIKGTRPPVGDCEVDANPSCP